YMAPLLPFMVLAIVLAAGLLIGPAGAPRERTVVGTCLAGVLTLAALWNFRSLYPIFVGEGLPYQEWDDRTLFGSWIRSPPHRHYPRFPRLAECKIRNAPDSVIVAAGVLTADFGACPLRMSPRSSASWSAPTPMPPTTRRRPWSGSPAASPWRRSPSSTCASSSGTRSRSR